MVKSKKDRLYDVVWIVNGKDKETLEWAKPIAIARWAAKGYGRTTHKTGKVIARIQK